MLSVLDQQIEQMRADAEKAKSDAIANARQTYLALLHRRNAPRDGDATALIAAMATAAIDPKQHDEYQRALSDVEQEITRLRHPETIAAIRREAADVMRNGVQAFATALGAWFTAWVAKIPENERWEAAIDLADLLRRRGDCPEAQAIADADRRAHELLSRANREEQASQDAEYRIGSIRLSNRELFGGVLVDNRWTFPDIVIPAPEADAQDLAQTSDA